MSGFHGRFKKHNCINIVTEAQLYYLIFRKTATIHLSTGLFHQCRREWEKILKKGDGLRQAHLVFAINYTAIHQPLVSFESVKTLFLAQANLNFSLKNFLWSL